MGISLQRKSEYQVNYCQHNHEKDNRHSATDPYKIGYAVTTGANNQGIDLMGWQDK